MNRRVFRLLRELPLILTVRYVLNYVPSWYGEKESGVAYVRGSGQSEECAIAVDAFDCVVGAAWTLPCIAIARGTPTVIYGQYDELPDENDPDRYPIDCTDIRNSKLLLNMIQRACESDAEIAAWRDRFIGPQFDPWDFVAKFERAVKEW